MKRRQDERTNLANSNWELLVEESKGVVDAAWVAEGALDEEADVLCVAAVVALGEEENVVGADMTCVCRRGNRNACNTKKIIIIHIFIYIFFFKFFLMLILFVIIYLFNYLLSFHSLFHFISSFNFIIISSLSQFH